MASLLDELQELLWGKANELDRAGKREERMKMSAKAIKLELRRYHVDRLQEARNKRLAQDEKQIKDLEKKLDEEESKKKVIEKKLDKENVHSTRLRALKNSQKKQGASIDIEMKQNAIDMKGIQDDLKKQSDNCDGISDEIKRLRKRLEKDTRNVAEKHQELFVYLSVCIDDNQYQQLELDAQVREWFGLQVDEIENINRFDDLWNILKSRGKIAFADYLRLEGWLVYHSNIFDETHLTEEIRRIEDAILEPYDTTVKRSLSDYDRKNKYLLGKGTYGEVSLYHHKITDEQIAVKEIHFPPNVITTEDEAFMVEVKIMRELSRYEHPNIVQYFFEDIDKDSGELYIGMEYLTGGSLTRRISGNPLPEAELRKYTHQILRGVKFLHDKHVAHRDIKCDNILLGLNDRIKLADFGISKKLKASLLSHGATTAGAGTCQYMSPEVVKGYSGDPEKNEDEGNGIKTPDAVKSDGDESKKKEIEGCGTKIKKSKALKGDDDYSKGKKGYGIKTDIWSVGCVVLEMATGKRPWSGFVEPMAVMFRVGNGETPPIADSVPGDVKDFLAKTFIVKPADRSSAVDLLKHKLVADLEERYLKNMETLVAIDESDDSDDDSYDTSADDLETADEGETASSSSDYMQLPKRHRSGSDTSDVLAKKKKVSGSP